MGIVERFHLRERIHASAAFEIRKAVPGSQDVNAATGGCQMFHHRMAARAVAHSEAIDEEQAVKRHTSSRHYRLDTGNYNRGRVGGHRKALAATYVEFRNQ